MKQTGKCPKCGGREIVADAMAIDRSHGGAHKEMTLATFQNPNALIFRGRQQTTVSAWMCSKCGFVEFYADNPGEIKLSDPFPPPELD